MSTFVLLKGKGYHQGYALYQDGGMVANFSFHDQRPYIEQQLAARMSEGDELTEKNHDGPWPERTEPRVKRKRRTNAEIAADNAREEAQNGEEGSEESHKP